MKPETGLSRLNHVIIGCRKCPRLVAYLKEVPQHKPRRFLDWDYWAKPLPGFGDPQARALIVGLAPAAHGGNRTGRMFTGDRSGEWLFRALHAFGFANQHASTTVDDGFKLIDCYITATIRCAPPANKPLPGEIENCRPYLMEELDLLKQVRLFIPLGQIAFSQIVKVLRTRGTDVPPLSFGHGRVFPLASGQTIVASYHPSQQNTQTGKLTQTMFHQVFTTAKTMLED